MLTSNRTRDLHDAVKRRCLYHWIDYPDVAARGRDRAAPCAGLVADARRPGGERGLAHARHRRAEAARHRRGDRLAAGARTCSASSSSMRRPSSARSARCSSTARTRTSSARPASPTSSAPVTDEGPATIDFGVETIHLDLPPLVTALGSRLHEAGLPVTPARSADFARALSLVRPESRRRLYWTARAVFVSDPVQVKAFDAVFSDVFGDRERRETFEQDDAEAVDDVGRRPARRRSQDVVPRGRGTRRPSERRVGTGGRGRRRRRRGRCAAGDGERRGACSRRKRFDALAAARARAAVPADVAPASWPRRCAAPAATSAAATASASTCAGRCAAACAPAAIRSASRAGAGASCRAGS